MKEFVLLAFAVACLLPGSAMSQKQAPQYLSDKGACPGECCTYGRWKAERKTELFSLPDVHSKRVATIPAGTQVRALTGRVNTIPSRFVVKKSHRPYRPGDVLWVYTYRGEGIFKVWFKGRMRDEQLEFSPYGGSSGVRCEQAGLCWGELDRDLRSTWWIRIRTPAGVEGWTNQGTHFSGGDACA